MARAKSVDVANWPSWSQRLADAKIGISTALARPAAASREARLPDSIELPLRKHRNAAERVMPANADPASIGMMVR